MAGSPLPVRKWVYAIYLGRAQAKWLPLLLLLCPFERSRGSQAALAFRHVGPMGRIGMQGLRAWHGPRRWAESGGGHQDAVIPNQKGPPALLPKSLIGTAGLTCGLPSAISVSH